MTATLQTAIDWASLGRAPIPGTNPAGVDVRYEPEFEALQAEIDLSVSAGSRRADWEKVAQLAGTILAEKSKDLLVAGYLAVALVHTRKSEGLELGSAIYADLLQGFWDSLFPSKARLVGRTRAIGWWIEKTAAAVRNVSGTALAESRRAPFRAQLNEITELLTKALGDDAPSLQPLTSWLEQASAVPEPLPSATSSSSSIATLSAKLEPIETPMVQSAEDAKRAVDRLADGARRVAQWLLSKDAASAAAYRLSRWALWIGIEDLPTSSGGKTLLPPPEPRLRERLLSLRKENSHLELLSAAEDAAFQHLFWLDAQRYAAETLAALGDAYVPAAQALHRETASFLARVPGVEALMFSDGSPFADVATREWLGQPVHAPMPAAIDAASEGDADANALQRIRQFLKSRKLADAAALFESRLRDCRSAREQLLWRMTFAAGMLGLAGRSEWAAVQIERILDDVQRYKLEEFESPLALRASILAVTFYRAQADDESQRKAQALLQRVGQLDLSEYLRQKH